MRSWTASVEAARRHPWLVDGSIAAALTAIGTFGVLLGTALADRTGVDRPPIAVGLALSSTLTVPLVLRRRAPGPVLVAVTVVFAAHRIVAVPEYSVSSIALFIALVSAGAYAERRRRAVLAFSILVSVGVLVAGIVFDEIPVEVRDLVVPEILLGVLLNAFFFAAALILGATLRARDQRGAALAERTLQLELEREEKARRAVMDERVRIARELHDVVAHHVSVMGVQAGAARRVMERRPDLAAEALTTIEASSREAVTELQRLLGFLRREDEVDSLAPQPSLRQVADLVERTAAAGVPVELVVDGPVDRLPASVDLSAYRVVQEALTNVRKHAGPGARANVRLTRSADALTVEVVDDGGAGRHRRLPARAAAGAPGGGLGQVGMRERVALHGGTLDARPQPGGGYRVTASFPLSARGAA